MNHFIYSNLSYWFQFFQFKSKNLKFVIGFQEGELFSLFYLVGFWFDEKSFVEWMLKSKNLLYSCNSLGYFAITAKQMDYL